MRTMSLFMAVILLVASTSCEREKSAPPLSLQIPQRVIAMAPGLTEIVYAVGAGDALVGISSYSVYPPEALKKPTCGGYTNPNFETILSLQPDLVLIQGRHEKLREFCRANNLPMEEFKLDSLADIPMAIRQAGKLFACEEQAEKLCEKIRNDLETLRPETPRDQWPKVFICPTRQAGSMANIMTAGRDSFLNEMLEIAGGVNIFGELNQLYPQISKEDLLVRAPDVILELRPGEDIDEGQAAKLRSEWEPLALLPAVREGRIRIITDDAIQIPTPRIAESVRRLQEAIYQNWEGKQP